MTRLLKFVFYLEMQLRIQQENNGLKLFLFINRGIRVVLMVVSVKDCNQRGGHHLRIEGESFLSN